MSKRTLLFTLLMTLALTGCRFSYSGTSTPEEDEKLTKTKSALQSDALSQPSEDSEDEEPASPEAPEAQKTN
jgi:hypothetical protein